MNNSEETVNSPKAATGEGDSGMGVVGERGARDHLFYNKPFSTLRLKLCACISLKIVR